MNNPFGVSLADVGGVDDVEAEPVRRADRFEHKPPVLIERLNSDVYHRDPDSVAIGGLSLLRRSPYHFWYHHRRPKREVEPPTPAQVFGLAVHCMILEPDQFPGRLSPIRPLIPASRARRSARAAPSSGRLGSRLRQSRSRRRNSCG